MKIGVRGKLFLLSIAVISSFGLASGIFLEARLRSLVSQLGLPADQLHAAVGELRAMLLVAALVGLVVAGFMSVVASQLMSRTLRELVRYARAVASGDKEAVLTPLPQDEVGRLAGSVKRIADDLQQTVQSLSAERDRLRAILLAMHDAVVVLDGDGRISLANDAAGSLLSLHDRAADHEAPDHEAPDHEAPDHEAPDLHLADVVDEPELIELAKRGLAGESISTMLTLDSAGRRQLQTEVVPLESMGAVLVMHDITHLRRLETMRRDFVGNVSHELRTPVSVIRVNAETLLDGALDDEVHARRFVERILRSAERLSHLVGDLLDLSRIEAGRYATKMDRISVAAAVEVVMEDVKVRAAERGTRVAVEVPGDIVAQGDATALEQILQNLIDNAISYTPEGGHVRVTAALDGHERVRIEVQDDGPGIAPQHRTRIFERFYRVDPGRSREMGGTGLGLAIVKHLVESMGGDVGVSEAPGGGALLWLELQRATATLSSLPPSIRPSGATDARVTSSQAP